MNLDEATKRIKQCVERMAALYRQPVFDEWALVSLDQGRGRVLAYSGPRKDEFRENFLADAGALRPGILGTGQNVGDFEFARQGVGTMHESYLLAGEKIYLICNNTARSMDDITKDSLWLGAQVPFAELSEAFRADPLELSQ